MIDIQWKGKIGYGDIISPICYAHNISYKLGTKVDLTFRWAHGPLQKSHSSDPETLWGRANYINMLCDKQGTDVNVIHRFENPLDINHTNYEWDAVGGDAYHNYWQPVVKNKPSSHMLVVNSTEGNVVSLKQYGKAWKDPAAGKWHHIIEQLSKKFEVVVVDYRTPVESLIKLLREARGFIGYHGTASWPAKFMHTPSILFASGGNLTRNAFPYAFIESDIERIDTVLSNVDSYLDRSHFLDTRFQQAYKTYTPSTKLLQSLHHEL